MTNLDKLREAMKDDEYVFPSLWRQCSCGACTDTGDYRSPYCNPDTGLVPECFNSDLEAVGPVLRDWMRAGDWRWTDVRLTELEDTEKFFFPFIKMCQERGWLPA